jgi:hypothetical protein
VAIQRHAHLADGVRHHRPLRRLTGHAGDDLVRRGSGACEAPTKRTSPFGGNGTNNGTNHTHPLYVPYAFVLYDLGVVELDGNGMTGLS